MEQKEFDKLDMCLDKKVHILVTQRNGEDEIIEGNLVYICHFKFILIESQKFYDVFPFVGNMQGIKKITCEQKTFYTNETITYPTKITSKEELLKHANALREKTFGTNKFNLAKWEDDTYAEEIEQIKDYAFRKIKNKSKKDYFDRKRHATM